MAGITEDMVYATNRYPDKMGPQVCDTPEYPKPLIRQECAEFMRYITSSDAYRNCTPHTRAYINDLTLQIYDALKGE